MNITRTNCFQVHLNLYLLIWMKLLCHSSINSTHLAVINVLKNKILWVLFSPPSLNPPKKKPSIHTWRLRRFSPATARHSLSCGGGQSDCPSISTHTSPNSSSSCSNVLLHTSTMNGTLLLTIHCPPLVHANVCGKKITNTYMYFLARHFGIECHA